MKLTQQFREIGQPSSHKRKQAYRIGAHIGSGEFGEVKIAHSVESGEPVAIKIVSKGNYANLAAQAHRLEEYSRLSHPNVMKLIEWFESKERYYFVLQYMAGGELYDVVEKRGFLPEDEARALAKQLFEALAYLHSDEVRIVHRDLKLENILCDETHKHVTVADMGLAVRLEKPDQKLYARCGSLGYSAPEVYSPKREGYGRECDVWSLGVIVFIMLGGRFPFTGATPQEVAEEGLQGRIRFTNTAPWTDVSTEAIDLIRCCLDPDVERRITAADALKHPWLLMADGTAKLAPADYGGARLQRTDTQVTTHDTAGLSLRRTVTQIHDHASSDEESTPTGTKDEEQQKPKPEKPEKAATKRLIV